MSTIAVQRLSDRALLPQRQHDDDAGFDLHAAEAVELPPGARLAVGCGFAIAIPPGFAGLILPRSGMALRAGVTVLNAPGLIDAGYRGELRVLLINHDPVESLVINVGDRIAQLVVTALPSFTLVECAELPASARGDGGFGSTGRGA